MKLILGTPFTRANSRIKGPEWIFPSSSLKNPRKCQLEEVNSTILHMRSANSWRNRDTNLSCPAEIQKTWLCSWIWRSKEPPKLALLKIPMQTRSWRPKMWRMLTNSGSTRRTASRVSQPSTTKSDRPFKVGKENLGHLAETWSFSKLRSRTSLII